VTRRLLTTPAGRVLGIVAAVVLAAWWSVTLVRGRWAVRIPDDRHTYGIRVRGGVDLFFPAQLGWFVDHALSIFFALLILTVAAEWATRRRQGF
jgi:hypothetical protein